MNYSPTYEHEYDGRAYFLEFKKPQIIVTDCKAVQFTNGGSAPVIINFGRTQRLLEAGQSFGFDTESNDAIIRQEIILEHAIGPSQNPVGVNVLWCRVKKVK